ncbi:MAG: alpha/beta fold hydrolase [Chitinophagales bacterium]|nr:alpha/beta fold hydrolase [Chitinophagales bacterium]
MQTTTNNHTWLNRSEYPFRDNYISLNGVQMHYVDEGKGDAIVFVHGTPSWTFDFRNQIKELSKTHRCIAADHIGFGLSDKPEHYNYSVQQHSNNLAKLIEHLQLDSFTLVVHDFGGPIGLNYAIQHPDKIQRLVILNTWLWSTRNEPEFKKAEPILKSPLLPVLYKYFNFSARFMVKQSWGNKKTLTSEIHRHYKEPFSKPSERMGTIAFAKALLNEQDFFESLWNKVDVLSNKPTLILWGELDEFVPVRFAEKFMSKFHHARFQKFNAGHFLQDESQRDVTSAVKTFLLDTSTTFQNTNGRSMVNV